MGRISRELIHRAALAACLAALLPPLLPAQARGAEAIATALAGIPSQAPGCAVVAERDGRIIAAGARGLASLEQQVPFDTATVSYAGSVSKQFVAAAVVLLAETGRLSLDDPVGRHVPGLPEVVADVSLWRLLHHTGGVRDYLSLATRQGRDWAENFTNDEALSILRGEPELDFPAGAAWRYSNGGYLLLGEVVARASGGSLRAYADSALLAPLGMASSHFHDRLDHPIARLATGYRVDSTGTATPWPLAFAAVGSGGLYTTAADLARWSGNWWDNRLGAADRAFADRMTVGDTLDSGEVTSYALGVINGEFEGHPIRRHGGGLAGYRSALLQLPDQRLGIAVLCNAPSPGADVVAERVAREWLRP